jgi:hypothetical protein
MDKVKNEAARQIVWPVIFLLAVLALIWYMATHAHNMGQAALILLGVLLLAGIAQRITFYVRRGRPRLVD